MPSDPPSPIPVYVVAAVIRRGERFLVGLRPTHKRHGGLWEFPGGKLDDGETPREGATRELAEELGVGVSRVGDAVATFQDPGSHFVIAFHEVEILGDPQALEHEELRWCRLDELTALPLAPSDARFVALGPGGPFRI